MKTSDWSLLGNVFPITPSSLFVFFEGATPVELLCMVSSLQCYAKYIPKIKETSYLVCQVTRVYLFSDGPKVTECFSSFSVIHFELGD